MKNYEYTRAMAMNDRANRLTVQEQAKEGSYDAQRISDEARFWIDYLMWRHKEGKYRSQV